MENKSRFREAKSLCNFVESFSGKAVQSHGHQTGTVVNTWFLLCRCRSGGGIPTSPLGVSGPGALRLPRAPPLSTPRTASSAQFY